MATYTVEEIIRIAKVSGYLTANDIATGALSGEKLDPDWNVRLYLERKAVEWMYRHDPAYPTLTSTANYLFALCGGYGRRAAVVLAAGGAGSVVSPISPASDSLAAEGDFVYLIPIKGTDFYSATEYRDTRIVGEEVQVFWNEANRYLTPLEFTYTPNGIQILSGATGIEGFDATTTHADATFKIYLVHPDLPAGTVTVTPGEGGGSASSGTPVTFTGDGTYALGAGQVLEYIIVLAATNASAFKIGATAGGSELLPESEILTTGSLFTLHRYSYVGETLYLGGVPAGTTIVFFTKAVNLT
jgi:hypothetical protein